jgi:predicted DNA-binding transcriptional regulator AlpA
MIKLQFAVIFKGTVMQQPSVNQYPKFLKLAEVSAITGLGKSTILSWESQAKFPRAVRLSPTFRVWLEADIHQWVLKKHAEQTISASPAAAVN